jgi:RNA polymerase sigma-70 factor (ECF subfamily)
VTRSDPIDLVELRPELPIDDMTDDGLVAACATGDRAARARLFERYVDNIHGFITRMSGSDREEIEDLVQITFLAAFQSADRYRGGNLRAWLYGIAANQVRSYVRREIRRKRALGAVADFAPSASEVGSPSLVAHLPAAVAALPHDLRAALVLIDLEGERGRDAALALGVPEGTLWRRVHLARKAVRIALGGEP